VIHSIALHSIAYWAYCDTRCQLAMSLVGSVVTRVTCGQTVRDTALDSTEVL